MSVNTQHPEYQLAREIWITTRAACEGNEAIKRGHAGWFTFGLLSKTNPALNQPTQSNTTYTEGAKRFLPGFIPDDKERYAQYIQRAYFMGVTGRTRDSLVGMIFRKPPEYTLPTRMEDMLENIDGAGQSLEQISKEAASNLLEVGRHILLVDYPSIDQNIDAETERRLGLQPTIASYPAESLINWRLEGVNGRQRLTLAVLAEYVQKEESDEFAHDTDIAYRVLRLRDGVYTQQMYNEKGNPTSDEVTPLMAGGAPFDHIPLHIVGAENNKPDIDMPPLYDLAIVNIAHYQTTADHRENLFIHGQLTLGITSDMGFEEFTAANPNGIKVGARVGHYLGQSGGFHTATAPESSILSAELEKLEDKMVMLGARLIQRGGQGETAEAARINASAEASTLDMLVNNLSEAIEAALEDVARFVGIDPVGIEYRLNTDFWESSLDAQTLTAIVQAGATGVIAKQDQLHMIRRGKIEIEEGRTNEQIQQDVASNLLDDPDPMPV